MKKNLFYLFALICSMSLFTACSDDDDPSWKKLPTQAITAENLSLTTNIPNNPDASVRLIMSDAQSGVIALSKAVRGMDEVEVNVNVTEQSDGSFKFQGEKNIETTTKAMTDLISSTTVRVEGTITLDGKAEVAVTTAATGNLVKKWNMCDNFVFDKKSKIAHAPFMLNWVSPYADADGQNAGLAAENIQHMGSIIVSGIMVKLLKDVEFKADGSIVANYAKDAEINQDEIISGIFGGGGLPSTEDITWLTSPANLAYWYAGNDHVHVLLNIPAIVAEAMKDAENPSMTPEAILGIVEMVKGMTGAQIKELLGGFLSSMGSDNILSKLDITKISDSDIEKLIGYVVNGFPLGYDTSEVALKDGSKVSTFHVYLEKEIFDIFMPALYPMLPDLDVMLKNMTVEVFGSPMPVWGLVQGLTGLTSLTEFEGVWKATTLFNVGLDLATGSLKDVAEEEEE